MNTPTLGNMVENKLGGRWSHSDMEELPRQREGKGGGEGWLETGWRGQQGQIIQDVVGQVGILHVDISWVRSFQGVETRGVA